MDDEPYRLHCCACGRPLTIATDPQGQLDLMSLHWRLDHPNLLEPQDG